MAFVRRPTEGVSYPQEADPNRDYIKHESDDEVDTVAGEQAKKEEGEVGHQTETDSLQELGFSHPKSLRGNFVISSNLTLR